MCWGEGVRCWQGAYQCRPQLPCQWMWILPVAGVWAWPRPVTVVLQSPSVTVCVKGEMACVLHRRLGVQLRWSHGITGVQRVLSVYDVVWM